LALTREYSTTYSDDKSFRDENFPNNFCKKKCAKFG
jgi:hypothetical protein